MLSGERPSSEKPTFHKIPPAGRGLSQLGRFGIDFTS